MNLNVKLAWHRNSVPNCQNIWQKSSYKSCNEWTSAYSCNDKSVDTLPQNGPFLHNGYTYPFPLSTPTPSPQNQCCILDPQVFFLLQTYNIDLDFDHVTMNLNVKLAWHRNSVPNCQNIWQKSSYKSCNEWTSAYSCNDKSVDTLPQNGPFLHNGYTYPFPLSTPTPSPQNQCCILDPQVFFLLQTYNIDLGGERIYAV